MGTVVGSNISNIALILCIAALVRPRRVEAQLVRLDGPILVGVSLLLIYLVQDGGLGHLEGVLLATGVVGYLGHSVWAAPGPASVVQTDFNEALPPKYVLFGELSPWGLGIGGLMGGADVLVDGAVLLAQILRVPKLVVGLTLVAVGTSLPELATSILAAYRGNGGLAIGNAVGS